jgi:hypothetical protein
MILQETKVPKQGKYCQKRADYLTPPPKRGNKKSLFAGESPAG